MISTSGIQTGLEHEDARLVQRQAFAGMIWNKQYYEYDVRRWLAGDSDLSASSRSASVWPQL